MSREQLFTCQAEYEVALLRLLCKLPGGQGKAADVCALFEQEYKDLIPQADRSLRPSDGELIWDNTVRWCRQYLKQRGFLDASTHGIWRVTEEGRRWAEEHPNERRIPEPPPRSRKGKTQTPPEGPSPSPPDRTPVITLEMLERTRKLMPADQFRQVWGALYDRLLAQERAKAITDVTQAELGRRARKRLDEIHAFLRGQNTAVPSPEVLCDWIHLCYALDLCREAANLVQFVREDEVDPTVYRRAKRVADACRSKLGR